MKTTTSFILLIAILILPLAWMNGQNNPEMDSIRVDALLNDSTQLTDFLIQKNQFYQERNINDPKCSKEENAAYEIYEYLIDSDYTINLFGINSLDLNYKELFFIPQEEITFSISEQAFDFNQEIIPVLNKAYDKYSDRAFSDSEKDNKYYKKLKFQSFSSYVKSKKPKIPLWEAHRYLNSEQSIKRTGFITNLNPILKNYKVIALDEDIKHLIYQNQSSSIKKLEKYIFSLNYSEIYDQTGEVYKIILSPNLNKAFVYFYVECGNGYSPTFMVKENGQWEVRDIIEYVNNIKS